MTNELLVKYFNFFDENRGVENWTWYKGLQTWIPLLNKIKTDIDNLEIDSLEMLNTNINISSEGSIKDIYAFLDRYLFMQDNGTANIGQGVIWKSEKNPHRQHITKKIKDDYTILLKILKSKDKIEASELIKSLINFDTRSYDAVRFRFLKTLFPEDFTSVDSPGKLDRLISALEKKLSIKVIGNSRIEKHDWLMKQLGVVNVYKKQIFYWELYYMLENDLDLKKAIVYYGAPGTGKTYKAKKEAEKFIDRWALKTFVKDIKKLIVTVQFHPSFAYEDFIEGIRPTKDTELKLKSGIFKTFCKEAGEVERTLWENSQFRDKFKDKSFNEITIQDINQLEDTNIKELLKFSDELLSTLTLQDIIEPAFFIIDEINRADLSRVFGELMYSLEYRGYNGKIKTQYSYLNEKENDESVYFWEDGQDWFFIPQNVYIIGTMNTIDRSVDSFDFALRRRFMWEEIEPDYDVIKTELDKTLNDKKNLGQVLSDSFISLNKKIKESELLGSDYQIGHSYALNIKNKEFESTKDAIEFLWKEFIKPLIQEYLRGLGDSQQSDKMLKEFGIKFGIK